MTARWRWTGVMVAAGWVAGGALHAQTDGGACADAARSLIDASSEVRVAAGGSSTRYGLGESTQSWRSVDGHEGVCRWDASGRLFQVEITRFPEAEWGGASYSLTCESDDNRRRTCPLRSGPAVVRLERQLSRTPCVEGRTFGIDGSALWVDDGCRGVFTVSASWQPYTLRCTSERYRRNECSTRDGSIARLVRSESRTPCVEGSNWGHYGSTLWVDSGCSGVFEIAPIGSSSGSVEDAARQACRRRAEAQGLQVLADLGTRTRGRYVDVTLRTSRRGIQMETTCTFDSATGQVEVYPQ